MAAPAPAPSLLPDDALLEILVRLPPCSIGRSRAVCRAWRAATTHPSFDRALAQRPPAVAKLTSQSQLAIFDVGSYGSCSTFNFDLFRGRWHRSNSAVRQDVAGPRPSSPSTITLARSDDEHWLFPAVIASRVLGSWDGVVVLSSRRQFVLPPLYHKPAAAEDYVLWNPLTGACATVPGPAGGGRFFGVIGGYAHPVTRRFHLLHSSGEAVPGRDDLLAPVTFRVLRIGGGGATWRELPLPPHLQDKDSASIVFMRSDRDRDRHVSVHGNLHWLVQSGTTTGRVALLVFDTAREEFRLMAAPERRPGLRLEAARTVLWSGKLCVLALAGKAPASAAGTMEMWVLNDYDSDPAGACWRLRRRIRMVRLDGADLSPAFMAATAVEVVEGVEEGEEIFLRLGDRIDAYNLREDAWRKVSVARAASLLMHRVSVLQPEMSFGDSAGSSSM